MKESINTIVTVENILYPKNSVGDCWGIVLVREVTDSNAWSPTFTLKGDLPKIDYGISYKVVGNFVEDKYGGSYEIKLMFPYTNFNDEAQSKMFLSTILTPIQIEALYCTLGKPMDVIKNHDIEQLCTVKGIKKYTANVIIDKYEENKIYEEAFADLCKYGLTLNLIRKVVKHFGSINKAVSVIKTDPYQLASQMEGIGFTTADEIGKKVGIDSNSPKRIGGYIRWYLNDLAQQGYSWISPNLLCETVTTALQLPDKEGLKITLKELYADNVLYWDNKKSFICLKYYYDLEYNIAEELKRLKKTKVDFRTDIFDDVVNKIQNKNGFEFTDEQIAGAKMIINSPISIITGFSGTGKSSSVQIALDCLKKYNSIAAVSFTGRAASRLTEATGFPASTIHKLLEYNPMLNTFMRNETSPLHHDIILIDECSFLDEKLFYNVLKALRNGTKIILVGDPGQLEPLGVGNLFSDMINCKIFEHTHLNKIHRQASKSGIITESHNVRNGIQIIESDFDGVKTFGELKDFHLIKNNKINEDFVLKIFKKEYEKYQDIMQVQIIAPLKIRGVNSVQKLNNKIQEWYNPELKEKKYFEFKRKGETVYIKVGDKIINTANSYDTTNTNFETIPIYNGFTGIVTDIDFNNETMIIDFGNNIGEIIIKKDLFDNIELGYVITIHKSQGSEWQSVIVVININAFNLLTRNLVYTAMTRAKKECYLCTDNKALKLAINTEKISKKQTFLCEMLKGGKSDE